MKIDSSHHQQAGVNPAAAFNFDQMHNTIDNIEASAEVPKKSSSRSKHVTDMSSAEAIHSASAANGKAIEAAGGSHSSNGKLVHAASEPAASSGKPDKKVKYKSLWGKVGKHGLMQAAAASKTTQNQDSASSGSSSTGSASNRNKRGSASTKSGWDQVLQPIMQKQQASETYQYNSYHAQQVQMGSASLGSGWTGANMECDCGEDSCPRCNLLLSMGDDQQW